MKHWIGFVSMGALVHLGSTPFFFFFDGLRKGGRLLRTVMSHGWRCMFLLWFGAYLFGRMWI